MIRVNIMCTGKNVIYTYPQTGPAALTNTSVGWSEYKEELVRGEIVALMFLRLIGLLGQTCFEVETNCMYRWHKTYSVCTQNLSRYRNMHHVTKIKAY